MCAVVAFPGCAATPLGSYLKALGVLRLVGEQKDPEARGWWQGDIFWLESSLDEAALERFFLEEYRPTPIVAPWNGGSGFYPKDNQEGISAIEESTCDRFAMYRQAIATCRAFPDVLRGKDIKAEDERRTSILLSCRNELPEQAVDWLDAAVGISASGSRAFAPVLGTGGNEGRLDYTNNFMSRLAAVLIRPDPKNPVAALLRNALFDKPTDGLQDGAAGQYDPGRAGGANQGQGIEQKTGTNPWDLILTLEGAVSWASGLYRRQGVSYRSYLCSPFTVIASKVGYGSASEEEEARAEIWAPLWQGKTTYAELRVLLREGRATVTGGPAQTGLEFAEAAASLGVDRSIDRFVRYSLLKRRGDSYVALPTGIFPAGYRRGSDRIREISSILDNLDRRSLPKDSAVYERRVKQAMFDALLRDEPQRVREALAALGRLLRNAVTRGDGYLPRRETGSLAWIEACGAGAEVRIAAALASLYDAEAGSIRSNLQRGGTNGKQARSEFAWEGRTLSQRLVFVLERRLKSYSFDERSRPFAGRIPVHASDVALFIEGRADDDLIEDLLFAFACFDAQPGRLEQKEEARILPSYAALKYLFQPDKVGLEQKRLRCDAGIPALLRAGQGDRALEIACRQLWLAGLIPYKRSYSLSADPERMAAALLIPAWNFGPAVSRLQDRVAKA